MGGETSSGGSYIVESAPAPSRLQRQLLHISVGLGTLCASLTGTFLTFLLPKEQMESYGWRLVFVLGALLGIFGLYLRRSIGESEVFKRAAQTTSKKDRAACAPSCSTIGRACCVSFSLRSARRWRSISGPRTFLNLLRASGRISASTSFLASTFGLIAYSVSMPISGACGCGSSTRAREFVVVVRGIVHTHDSLCAGQSRIAAMDHGGRDEPDRNGQRRGRRQLRRAVSDQRARDWLGCPTTFPLPCLAAPRRISAPGSPVEECPTCSIGMSWRFAS